MITTHLAKLLMKTIQNHPVYSENEIGGLNEIFKHNSFVQASEPQQLSIMLKSSEFKYKDETNYPWDIYFDIDISSYLQKKYVLDLGCFTGGRSVAWYEKYNLQHITGIDTKQVFIDAAKQFAYKHNIRSDFKVGFAESLPFKNDTFDAILSFDVFEHVQNLQKTVDECYRVLKKGGRLFLVFPSYFHPMQHHLSLVTKVPCIHWFFSGKTCIKAYNEILEERGEMTYWYKRKYTNLESWERGNTINGITLNKFVTIINDMNWRAVRLIRNPIGSIGRSVSKNRLIRVISKLFSPLTRVPGLCELFLHRITYILEK